MGGGGFGGGGGDVYKGGWGAFRVQFQAHPTQVHTFKNKSVFVVHFL